MERVERLLGVLQDRFGSELWLGRACDLDAARRNLVRSSADYDGCFTRMPRQTETCWRHGHRDLDRVWCFQDARIVGSDNVMEWQGRRFHLPPHRHRLNFAGAKAQLHQTQEWNVAIYSEDMKIQSYNTGRVIFPR
jgi:hypothetical protein